MKLLIAAWTHIMAERSHGLMQKPETRTKKGMSQEETDFSVQQHPAARLVAEPWWEMSL